MDTTKEYIEMCRQATEIQTLCHQKDYNYLFYNFSDNEVSGVICVQGKPVTTNPTWLPRQDQLQEIYSKDLYSLLHDFDRWIEWGNQDSMQCDSMEQLWLAFVMKEKYNKVWNGTDWINE
jgi:hypothetical protein